jgi:general secretion pathway protein D
MLPLAPALAAVAACTSFPMIRVGSGADKPADREEAASQPNAEARGQRPSIEVLQPGLRPSQPSAGDPSLPALETATPEQIAELIPERQIEVVLPPQPLPQFVDTVFGQLLQTPYYTGPGVAERRDFVSLRGPVSMSSRRFFATIQVALRQYGLAVQIEGGAVRIVEDPVLVNRAPLFIRSRALPEIPEPSRPVIQFFELQAVDVQSMMTLLQEAFPRRGSVTFAPRPDMNTLVISGNARDVASAAAVVNQLDRPRFANGQIGRIRPIFWSAEQLAGAISDALRTEGYLVSGDAAASRAGLVFLPMPFANEILVFSASQDVFQRALYWADQLDRAAALGDAPGAFIYEVQNTTAEDLAEMMGAGGGGASLGANRTNGGGGLTTAPERRVQTRPGGAGGPGALDITVDSGGNRIIFRGTASEFERARALMVELDTPVKQVLIELTIAEVTLNDATRFGVEWLLRDTLDSATVRLDTRGATRAEPGGLGAIYSRAFTGGSVQAALNAIATNTNLNIISTPRLVTRSGGNAQILVGTDVPIITSQRASDNQTGGDTDILQSVQYRQTGVILNVRPIIFGDDRIKVEIYQEVSSSQANETTSIDSPTILNRSVSTELTLNEGTTGIIGGLMQDNFTRRQTGVPLLKDIPVVGAAFRKDSVSGDKTELIILVTPFVVRNEEHLAAITADYALDFNSAIRRRGPQTYTLLPLRNPLSAPVVHGGPQAPAPVDPEAETTVPADIEAKAKTEPALASAPEPATRQAQAPAEAIEPEARAEPSAHPSPAGADQPPLLSPTSARPATTVEE